MMQLTMSLEECARCGRPIRSGEPHTRVSTIDVIDGRVVATPPKSYHARGACPDDTARRERFPDAA